MKAKLQKNKRDWHVYLPVVIALLIVVAYALFIFFSDTLEWSNIMSVTPVLFFLYFPYLPYQITDNNQLLGNGVVVIPLIQRVERKAEGGLRVFYVRMEGGQIRSRSFYPADEQLFIDTLQEINPNFKVS